MSVAQYIESQITNSVGYYSRDLGLAEERISNLTHTLSELCEILHSRGILGADEINRIAPGFGDKFQD